MDSSIRYPDSIVDCRACPRLATFLDEVRAEFPSYHARPVVPFGADDARLLVVGLAPGKHGANATGRPFTGDHAGIMLYATLHQYGFSTAPESVSRHDGLRLLDCRITNAVKCLPPQNKPIGSEVNSCNGYLARELETVPYGGVVVALGGVAHKAVIKAQGLRQKEYCFSHNQQHDLPSGLVLIDSYHCSRYNTQTRRLTPEMFHAVFEKARRVLSSD